MLVIYNMTRKGRRHRFVVFYFKKVLTPLVAQVPVWVRRLAVLRVVRHRSHEVDAVRHAGREELVPPVLFCLSLSYSLCMCIVKTLCALFTGRNNRMPQLARDKGLHSGSGLTLTTTMGGVYS